MNRFDRDTALERATPGVYTGRIDTGWWVQVGPNGGYVAAIILRGLTMELDDADCTPRSLTIHYVAPPVEGPVTVLANVERRGKRVAYLTGRMMQGDRVLAIAMAAFAREFDGPEFHDLVMPDVPSPAEVVPMDRSGGPPPIEMANRYEMLQCIGAAPFSMSPNAVSGGWIRLVESRPIDHLLVAALTDAWIPPVFSRVPQRLAVPTVDLTIHFRTPLPKAGLANDAWCLGVFRSQVAAHGFIEEDGEVWAPDGTLLAHSRQLAVTIAMA
jgi:acyl-CoA thioesterase